MNRYLKIIAFGLATWIIPFLFSFLFVGPGGNFLIPETFFKSIMVVTGALVGTSLAVKYLLGADGHYFKEGIYIGSSWLAINLAIDLIMVYLGFFDMTFIQYFTDIGLRYLSIPIFTVSIGYILEKK